MHATYFTGDTINARRILSCPLFAKQCLSGWYPKARVLNKVKTRDRNLSPVRPAVPTSGKSSNATESPIFELGACTGVTTNQRPTSQRCCVSTSSSTCPSDLKCKVYILAATILCNNFRKSFVATSNPRGFNSYRSLCTRKEEPPWLARVTQLASHRPSLRYEQLHNRRGSRMPADVYTHAHTPFAELSAPASPG